MKIRKEGKQLVIDGDGDFLLTKTVVDGTPYCVSVGKKVTNISFINWATMTNVVGMGLKRKLMALRDAVKFIFRESPKSRLKEAMKGVKERQVGRPFWF